MQTQGLDFTRIRGMDCLPLGKHMIFVLIVLSSLHLVKCAPYRQFPLSNGFIPVVPRFTSAPVYRQYLPFQRQSFNSWNGAPFYFTRAPGTHFKNQVVGNQLQNNFRSRVQNEQANSGSAFQPRWPSFRTYNSPSQNPNFVPMITRPPNKPPTKISVITGPLNEVIPHPKRRNMKAKKRLRYRLVAKAKSFPGILKDTSMDVTKVRSQQV